jgi:hypothetical protein
VPGLPARFRASGVPVGRQHGSAVLSSVRGPGGDHSIATGSTGFQGGSLELIIGLLVLALVATALGLRLQYWKEKFFEADAVYADIMQRAIRAEQEEAKVKDEMNRWQAMLANLQSRPVIATLNDQQAQALIQATTMFVSTNKSGAN